jgi:hypothetical protein
MFKGLVQEKIKLFTKICKVAIYSAGETVHMDAGGVIFQGSIKEINEQLEEPDFK